MAGKSEVPSGQKTPALHRLLAFSENWSVVFVSQKNPAGQGLHLVWPNPDTYPVPQAFGNVFPNPGQKNPAGQVIQAGNTEIWENETSTKEPKPPYPADSVP
jgi:hypothetical protein